MPPATWEAEEGGGGGGNAVDSATVVVVVDAVSVGKTSVRREPSATLSSVGSELNELTSTRSGSCGCELTQLITKSKLAKQSRSRTESKYHRKNELGVVDNTMVT